VTDIIFGSGALMVTHFGPTTFAAQTVKTQIAGMPEGAGFVPALSA
jgi:hypothetical protein